MLDENTMTPTARTVYYCLDKNRWKDVEYLARLNRLSIGNCQLILTQLALAGLAHEDESGEQFKRRK